MSVSPDASCPAGSASLSHLWYFTGLLTSCDPVTLWPVVHNQLLCFAQRCQGSDLLSVGRFVDIISRLDYGVGAAGSHAVMREQGVQERAEYAALRGAVVESQGGGWARPGMPSGPGSLYGWILLKDLHTSALDITGWQGSSWPSCTSSAEELLSKCA